MFFGGRNTSGVHLMVRIKLAKNEHKEKVILQKIYKHKTATQTHGLTLLISLPQRVAVLNALPLRGVVCI